MSTGIQVGGRGQSSVRGRKTCVGSDPDVQQEAVPNWAALVVGCHATGLATSASRFMSQLLMSGELTAGGMPRPPVGVRGARTPVENPPSSAAASQQSARSLRMKRRRHLRAAKSARVLLWCRLGPPHLQPSQQR